MFSRPAFTGCATFSQEEISSSDIWPESAELVIILTFSTSNSLVASLSVSSCRDFRASARARNSFLKDLYGLSFFWASVSFCWRPENSVKATLRVSGANFRACCNFKLICERASVIFVCESAAASSISSVALLRMSPSSSGGSAMRGAAIMTMASTESSAVETVSFVDGSASFSSLESRSSATLFTSAISACFLALTAPVVAFVNQALIFVISAAMPVCSVRSLGDSLESSVTELMAGAPPFLASVMSWVSVF
mmetsp:Transcript_28313/g.81320  ORF Transcript_28313/g.81320 Transcript_28313/m.81320 type:complete len:253 (+) Transcript_28313:440-1198(+)